MRQARSFPLSWPSLFWSAFFSPIRPVVRALNQQSVPEAPFLEPPIPTKKRRESLPVAKMPVPGSLQGNPSSLGGRSSAPRARTPVSSVKPSTRSLMPSYPSMAESDNGSGPDQRYPGGILLARAVWESGMVDSCHRGILSGPGFNLSARLGLIGRRETVWCRFMR